MVKYLNGWEISKNFNKNCKVFVKTFSGAKTACTHNYVNPSVRSSPNHFIFHVGTNDLSPNKSTEEIARSIIDLALTLQHQSRTKRMMLAYVTSLFEQTTKKLEEKRCEENSFLGKLCKEKNYYLIDHSTRIKRNHLNKGKLHLNQKSTKLFE